MYGETFYGRHTAHFVHISDQFLSSLCTHIRPVLVKNMLILASYVKQMDIYLRKVYIVRKVTSALGERGG